MTSTRLTNIRLVQLQELGIVTLSASVLNFDMMKLDDYCSFRVQVGIGG